MACPDCGSPTGDLRFATSVETHGLDCGPYEIYNEEFIVCGGCGGRFGVHDWDPPETCERSASKSESRLLSAKFDIKGQDGFRSLPSICDTDPDCASAVSVR
jgi:hypothetical protein